jgi:general transcription factor 3C polypeptide 5 (transcription factor C subunit 1)
LECAEKSHQLDAVIKYGVDPRSDPKYRIYQTLMFKLKKRQMGDVGENWKEIRREQVQTKEFVNQHSESHIFDGKTYFTDGKIWQVCDITDKILVKILENAPIRETCSLTTGWYHGGTWMKVKSVMKNKLTAIQLKRNFTDADYSRVLTVGDMTPPGAGMSLRVPVPELILTEAERKILYGKNTRPRKRNPTAPLKPRWSRGGVRQDDVPGPSSRSTSTSLSAPDLDARIEQDLFSLAEPASESDSSGSSAEEGYDEEGEMEGSDDERLDDSLVEDEIEEDDGNDSDAIKDGDADEEDVEMGDDD